MEQNAQSLAKSIKVPGPDHPISIERSSSRVVVSVAGRVIADTREELTRSYEKPYPAVAGIVDHLAFYPDRVDGIEIRS